MDTQTLMKVHLFYTARDNAEVTLGYAAVVFLVSN